MTMETTTTVTLRIGSEQLTEGSGTHEHVNPATGKVTSRVPLAGAKEVDLAVDSADRAFPGWAAMSGFERAKILGRLADLLELNTEEFATRGALENGSPVSGAAATVAAGAEWIRYYAGWADKSPLGQVVTSATGGEVFAHTLKQPYGVVGIIITWNAPLMSLCMKLPPALAAGNAVVVKPSEFTPFSAMLFADLAREAGIPDGVINVLPGGPDAGDRLTRHPRVKKVSFTGGPVTARKIAAACAETFKPLVLELGGKSANIIFDDADLSAAAQFSAFMSVGLMSGQGCAFPTRLLVQSGVYDQVVEMVSQIAAAIPVGDPFDKTVVSGPVINADAVERISGMVDRAPAEGARLVSGGARLAGELSDGYYFSPTVFADVAADSELYQREVFGPVLAITRFEDEAEAVALANATEYGLSGYLWTSDHSRVLRVTEQLETGGVLVNGATPANANVPFGGIGLSGYGREGGVEGLEEFLWTKTLASKVSPLQA